jgi:hypothetical protein
MPNATTPHTWFLGAFFWIYCAHPRSDMGSCFMGSYFKVHQKTRIYIYWSLTFLSLSRKLDMYPKSDVLSSSVRLKHYIFKRLYIIFTHTHLYIPSMLFERKSKKLFLLDSYGVPQKKHRWSFQVALGHPATRVAALRDRSPHPVDYTWCNHQF